MRRCYFILCFLFSFFFLASIYDVYETIMYYIALTRSQSGMRSLFLFLYVRTFYAVILSFALFIF